MKYVFYEIENMTRIIYEIVHRKLLLCLSIYSTVFEFEEDRLDKLYD